METIGYIEDRQLKMTEIDERIAEVKAQMRVLNRELGNLDRLAWGYYCDIVNYRGSNETQMDDSVGVGDPAIS